MRVRASCLLLRGLSTLLRNACCTVHREQPAPAATGRPAARPDWPAFAAAFIESRFKADPVFRRAIRAPRVRRPDAGLEPRRTRGRRRASCAATRRSCEKFDAATLTAGAALRTRVPASGSSTREIFWQANAEQPFRNPAWYLEQARSFDVPDARIRAVAAAPARVFSAMRAPCRASRRRSAPTCARRCRGRSSSAASAASAATPTFFRSEMPADLRAARRRSS